MTTEKVEGGEFIDRETQRPPEDSPGNVAQGPSTAAAQTDLGNTPLGAPPACYDVRSVYDSRPVNGYDFTITVTDVGDEATFPLEFTVRQGYVAVLLGFSHWIEDDPLPPIVFRNDMLATLQKNKVQVQDNVDVPVGLFSDNLWTGFIVADEFETLGLVFSFSDPALDVGQRWVTFRGNYLLKSGRASNFEIANPAPGPGCSMPLPPPPVSAALEYRQPPPRAARPPRVIVPEIKPAPRPIMAPPPVAPKQAATWPPKAFHSAKADSAPKGGTGRRR